MINTYSTLSTPSSSRNPSLLSLTSPQITQTSFFTSSSFTNVLSNSFVRKPSRLNPDSNYVTKDLDGISKSYLEIKLVEPVIFFRGKAEESVGCVLRGDLMVHLSKPTRIRKLEMKFVGKTKTHWKDRKTLLEERELISHTWKFLTITNEEIVEESIDDRESMEAENLKARFKFLTPNFRRGVSKNGDRKNSHVTEKLPAGIHTYPFELFLPGNLPETVNTELGNVSYYLHAKATRSRFKPNIILHQPIEILRTIPDHVNTQGIAFSREFNDMLSYEISIPKKGYPIGQTIPIEMKICPYVKRLRVISVKVELVEKTTYTSHEQKVTDSKVGTTKTLFKFGEERLIEDHEEGDVGNVVYSQVMHMEVPKCASPIHYSCATPLISVAHDLKFTFSLTLPDIPSNKAELKICVPITILSCKALEDYVGLPSYEDSSSYCPCDPEYMRMARLVLGEDAKEILKNGSCKFFTACNKNSRSDVHEQSDNYLTVPGNHYAKHLRNHHQSPPSYEASIAESFDSRY
ncbi:10089_t:CDS:2 [Acaulospora morrowiae]|uniref:10089_t:CDS:1 n=1 Tax=Acaulospora morrowiae TaxID=94023 RepID=A0A9N8ZE18_9GLOM|nr:10089_t:CDS:2 [Acaulospora morrowiae]